MIKLVGVHRLHDRNVIDNRGQMRQELRKLSARFAVPLKRMRSAQHLRHALDERKPLLLEERFRAILPVQLLQLRFVIEQVQLRRRTGHVQINHPLRFCWKMRRFGGQWIRWTRRFGPKQTLIQQRGQRDRSQPDPAVLEEMAPGDCPQIFRIRIHRSVLHHCLIEIQQNIADNGPCRQLHRVIR